MTGLVNRAVLSMAVALATAGSAFSQVRNGEPFELVRSLQSLQDQVAQGNTRAHAYQRVLMAQIAERFAAMHADRWKEPRNARAALVFVLSGGHPRVLRQLLDSGMRGDLDEKLLKGALAYAEGRAAEAAELLQGVDARTLEASIAGHVAFVQGEVTAKTDPAKALTYLDDARLLSPGTLIEEAAFRRQLALVGAAGDVDGYEKLATRYLRRFPRSVYAGSFQRQFAAELVARTSAGDQGRLPRLAAMLASVGPTERRDIYLTVAKEALLKGKVEMAKFAASHAASLAKPGSAEQARSQVFEAAALVVTDQLETGVDMLSGVDRSRLDEPEAALIDAALAVAVQVRRDPVPGPEGPPPADADEKTEVRGRGMATSGGQLETRARNAIARVDRILDGARQ
jgi:chemotaxis protein MotC